MFLLFPKVNCRKRNQKPSENPVKSQALIIFYAMRKSANQKSGKATQKDPSKSREMQTKWNGESEVN